jgi:predicted Zn-dependent protease
MLKALGRLRLGLYPIALAAALGGCASNHPKIGGYNKQAEVDKGSKQDKRIVERSGVLQKADLSEYVSAVGAKIAAASDRPDLQWRFTVLDSPEPNAFATRGGYVYITRGMLATLGSESELAAVLAHEVAHICTRDAMRKQTNGNLIGLGTLAVVAATAPVALLFPHVVFAPGAAGMAAFSRRDELKADQHGVEYLRRAGYSPEGMSTVLDTLASLDAYRRDHDKSGRSTSGWSHRVFASHPSTDKRQHALNPAENSPRTSSEPEFLAHLDGLEFGSAKWTGIPSGSKRYFAKWDLMLEIPDGWTASMYPDKLWLFRKDGKARMSLERTDTSTTSDLCEALMPFAKGASLADLQRASEGGIQSCTGSARYTTRTIFGAHETVWRIGMVASDEAPGARYVFRGFRTKAAAESDPVFVSIARSIESLATVEDRPGPTVLKIRRVGDGDSFATLARSVRTANPEADLRVLNHRYPSGELEVGQLVKVIE